MGWAYPAEYPICLSREIPVKNSYHRLNGMQGAFATCMLAFLLPLSLWGQPSSIAINSAIINSANNQVSMVGVEFNPAPVRGAPSVSFNGVSLTLVSYTDTNIVATLPTGLAPGSYLLTVTNSTKDTASLDVTIGNQ
jgi:hypothetical protein